MKRVAVYFNEHSSNANLGTWRRELSEALYRYKVEFKSPLGLDMLSKELKRDVQNGVDSIIGIGGDGTANLMAQEIAGGKIKMFFIPAGTANDLCNQLKVTGDINDLVNIFKTESTLTMDVITINDSKMLTNGGVGLPNVVAERINRYRHTLPGFKRAMKFIGGKIYSMMLGLELITGRYQLYEFNVSSEQLPISGKNLRCPMILVNNQAVLGNSFRIAPETSNNDGHYNVTIFTHKSKLSLLKCIFSVKVMGIIPHSDPNFHSFETSALKIESLSGTMVFFGDGEQLTESTIFNIGIEHKNLELITKSDNPSETECGIPLDAVSRL
ncbi:MAG: NAD(+)/NADH kinase [Bacteriovoracaceae bacterium]|nr:NAD(+)/NADH kinase [Bacteriovoracaceae bacterium]